VLSGNRLLTRAAPIRAANVREGFAAKRQDYLAGPGLPCARQTAECDGQEDGEAVVRDITPLQMVPVDEVLEEFQGKG
jgi:hypothetical protein